MEESQRDEIRDLALGLEAMGLSPGDRVAVVGANRPRLYWAICAIQSLQAIPVPVYADAVADEMAYVLDHAGARLAIVENQEQVDKIQSLQDRIPALTDVIYDEPRGLVGYDDKGLHDFVAIQQKGRSRLAAERSLRAGGKSVCGRHPATMSRSCSTPPARRALEGRDDQGAAAPFRRQATRSPSIG